MTSRWQRSSSSKLNIFGKCSKREISFPIWISASHSWSLYHFQRQFLLRNWWASILKRIGSIKNLRKNGEHRKRKTITSAKVPIQSNSRLAQQYQRWLYFTSVYTVCTMFYLMMKLYSFLMRLCKLFQLKIMNYLCTCYACASVHSVQCWLQQSHQHSSNTE